MFSHDHRVAISLFTLQKTIKNKNYIKKTGGNKSNIQLFPISRLGDRVNRQRKVELEQPYPGAKKNTPWRVVLTCRRCQTLTTRLTLVACGVLSHLFVCFKKRCRTFFVHHRNRIEFRFC